MTDNDQFIGQVEDYLVEFDGETPLPGRVLDAIHAELPRTRQAKARPGFMRMPPMLSTVSSRAPLGIAAAMVILAVVIGATYMNRNEQSGVGGLPVASPTLQPSDAPAKSPGAGSDVRALANAVQTSCPGITGRPYCLEPGTYQLGSSPIWPAAVTFDVPENWWWYEGGTGQSGILVQTEDIENGSGWGLTFETVGSVSIDPCDRAAGTWKEDKDTPGELAEAIGTWPGFEASEPEPISIGDYNGVKLTLTSSRTIDDCPSSAMWTTKNSTQLDAYPMVNSTTIGPRTAEFRIFNVDESGGSRAGELLVIRVFGFPETSPHEEDSGIAHDPDAHVEHIPALQSILDSIQISPFPEQ
jgi:hypothetical protein